MPPYNQKRALFSNVFAPTQMLFYPPGDRLVSFGSVFDLDFLADPFGFLDTDGARDGVGDTEGDADAGGDEDLDGDGDGVGRARPEAFAERFSSLDDRDVGIAS